MHTDQVCWVCLLRVVLCHCCRQGLLQYVVGASTQVYHMLYHQHVTRELSAAPGADGCMSHEVVGSDLCQRLGSCPATSRAEWPPSCGPVAALAALAGCQLHAAPAPAEPYAGSGPFCVGPQAGVHVVVVSACVPSVPAGAPCVANESQHSTQKFRIAV
jgi:hypothetical protein